ncbi:MAG TPA: lamin tail domain-containing protein [Anaerolineaceae bacterium]|jgi:hypothetical protein
MNQGKRLLFYIALNIVVSACTTLAILWIWNRPTLAQFALFATPIPTPPAAIVAPGSPTPAAAVTPGAPTSVPVPAASPEPTLSAAEAAKQISVDNVFGVGILKDEYVLLKRIGDGELNMTGWRLDDGNGNIYKFPSLTLYKNGAVQVHTQAGVDSVVDLYWGRSQSVWQVGKIVTLYDDKNAVRASYRIP